MSIDLRGVKNPARPSERDRPAAFGVFARVDIRKLDMQFLVRNNWRALFALANIDAALLPLLESRPFVRS